MAKTNRIIAMCTLISIATQPMLGMQAAPAPSTFYAKNKKIINITLGIAALTWATAIYLFSDRKVHEKFKAKVQETINQEPEDFSAEVHFKEDPRPLRVQPFPLGLNKRTVLTSASGKIKAEISHTTARTLGIPVHDLTVYYTTNTPDFDQKREKTMHVSYS